MTKLERNQDFNNITDLLPLIDKLRKALKRSVGNDLRLIELHFGPLISIFDTISVQDFINVKFYARRHLKSVSPIYDLGLFNFIHMKKLLATTRLLDYSTTTAIKGIGPFMSKDYRTVAWHFYYLTSVNFILRVAYTAFAYAYVACINSPYSYFDLTLVLDHFYFHMHNVYFFYIKPLFVTVPDAFIAIYNAGGKELILTNSIHFWVDVAILYSFYCVFCIMAITHFQTQLRNQFLTKLNKLKRTGNRNFMGLSDSVPVALFFFFRRFFHYYFNYHLAIKAIYKNNPNPFWVKSLPLKQRFIRILLWLVG